MQSKLQIEIKTWILKHCAIRKIKCQMLDAAQLALRSYIPSSTQRCLIDEHVVHVDTKNPDKIYSITHCM